MNIFLVPHTWARHLAVSLVVGGAALLTWWLFLFTEVVVGPTIGILWRQQFEGAFLLGGTCAVIAAASVLTEGSLRRQPLHFRLAFTAGAWLLSFILAFASVAIIDLLHGAISSAGMKPLVTDPSYVTLRYRLCEWGACGLVSGIVPLAIRLGISRKLQLLMIFDHLAGGLAAGMIGAATWHQLDYDPHSIVLWLLGWPADLYLSTAIGLFAFGFVHGLLVWGIPDELYAGWIRVLSTHRFGHRIPVDRPDGKAAERFLGHFPRGLDMYLAADKGIAELHVSFVSDGKQKYAVRGLSQQPTVLKRFLERVDLRYDPRRPAPLETDLSMEDRLLLGQGDQTTEVEFLLLPKEER